MPLNLGSGIPDLASEYPKTLKLGRFENVYKKSLNLVAHRWTPFLGAPELKMVAIPKASGTF